MADQPEMTELEILIAIHKAIDEAAAQSPAARTIAARYIPGYAAPNAVGWTESLDIALGLAPAKELQAAKAKPARTKAKPKDEPRELA